MFQTSSRLLNKIVNQTFVITTILILFASMASNSFYIYAQEQQQEEILTSPIVLIAKLADNQYKWLSSNNATNPTLNLTLGVDNQITIKSLEEDPEEHELIIEGISSDEEKEELLKSDEVEEGSSATINFDPADMDTSNYQTFEYYCEYHPETMRGKVQIN